ncbi:DUF421 domain-containing protein [Rhodococcus sp. NPDC060090]|uniref:DUF421 domain-containing protein n=1 Tax=Rhodococcus sp. NPDC060090 TaxID=3347056 RepID=UPI00365966CC
MPDWNEIFAPSVSVLELVVRGTVTYLVLMMVFRLVGQREAGGLGLTDLLVVVLVADAASVGLMGDADTIGDGFIVVGTMLFWSVVLDALSYRWSGFSRFIKARPRVLISEGQLNRRAMRREFMTYDEVLSQLRLHGISDIADVHRAYLEPSGMVSVIPAENKHVVEQPEKPAM